MFTSFPVLAAILLAPINVLAATTPPYCTTHYGSTSVSILTTSFAVSTRTTTITQSLVYATTTVSSGITTIPTPKGFTPIFSETTSVSLQIQAANAAAVAASQHPSTSYPASVVCTATYTTTITKTATAGQRAGTTVTSFSTVTVPATTFYAACDSNNIVDQGSGVGAGHAIQFTTVGGDFPYNGSTVFNSSAYGCCVSCLTTYPCAFSVLFTNYGSENPLACALNFREDGICDGGFSGGPAEYYYDPHDLGTQPGQGFFVSNGACGQIVYGGGFAREP